MKRKTTATRSVTKRPRRTMAPVSSPGAIERMARETMRTNPNARRKFAMHLASEMDPNILNMMKNTNANMHRRVMTMNRAGRKIQTAFRSHMKIDNDIGQSYAIFERLRGVCAKLSSSRYVSRNKAAFCKEIEARFSPLVALAPGSSDGGNTFTVEVGNDGFDPKINLQGRISMNRREQFFGHRLIKTRPYIFIGGYRVRARFLLHVRQNVDKTYTVTKVDIKSALISKTNVPAEVHIQSKRAQGPEAWYDRGAKRSSFMNVAHVFAAGIAVDAMLHNRPSKPKFHQVDLSRYYSNNSANSNDTLPYSPRTAATAPILAKLIADLKQRGYIDRDVEYVTNNRGVTNVRRNNSNRNNNHIWANNGYHSNIGFNNNTNSNNNGL
jgi:hypothetical protein